MNKTLAHCIASVMAVLCNVPPLSNETPEKKDGASL
jgi:hypothetical protein